MKAKLPNTFKHFTCVDLVRLGGTNDGGYLVAKADVVKSDILLSFGIGTDWNFEKDFAGLNDVPIDAYDASTNNKLSFKNSIGALFRLKLVKATDSLLKFFQFRRFFSKKRRHIPKFVELPIRGLYMSLEQVFQSIASSNIFLKMDIEGCEYRCLTALINNQSRICGAVIEFHDVDLHLSRLEDFIAAFGLPLVHIHANNVAHINSNGLPPIIELTFSRYGEMTGDLPGYPHRLDAPNIRGFDDIIINISAS